jgi:hypothetical protein
VDAFGALERGRPDGGERLAAVAAARALVAAAVPLAPSFGPQAAATIAWGATPL